VTQKKRAPILSLKVYTGPVFFGSPCIRTFSYATIWGFNRSGLLCLSDWLFRLGIKLLRCALMLTCRVTSLHLSRDVEKTASG